jgi:hypothetical protein
MAKKKTMPKPKQSAGYAARTAPSVHDSTKESEEEIEVARGKNTASPAAPRAVQTLLRTKRNEEKNNRSNHTVVKKKAPSGARVLKEIKTLQKTTQLLIPRAPFIRLVSWSIFKTGSISNYDHI